MIVASSKKRRKKKIILRLPLAAVGHDDNTIHYRQGPLLEADEKENPSVLATWSLVNFASLMMREICRSHLLWPFSSATNSVAACSIDFSAVKKTCTLVLNNGVRFP